MNLTEEQLEWLAELSGLDYVSGLNGDEPIVIENPYGPISVWEPHKITASQWQINILLKRIKEFGLDNQLYSLVHEQVGGGFNLLEVHPKIICQAILTLKAEGEFD